MEKVKLTYVRAESKTSKAGKPYESLSIKTDRYGDRFLSGFGSKETSNWKVGDEVEISVKEVASADGTKTYLNFEYPKKTNSGFAELKKEIELIKATLKPMYLDWKAKQTTATLPISKVEYPEGEINPNEIPF